MTKFRILRRPDGVIELRRRRLRDSATLQDAALLLGLCISCLLFLALLTALLVESPVLLAATAAFTLPVVSAVLFARSADLAPAAVRRPPRPPPPDRAA